MNTFELLVLKGIKGMGTRSLVKLARAFPATVSLLPPDPEAWLKKRLISAGVATSLMEKEALAAAVQRAEHTVELARRLDVWIVSLMDPDYPMLLRRIGDPPPILYLKGVLPAALKCVAVIGTRAPTPFGTKVARLTSQALSRAGWSVTAGLAVGVDTVSHEAALDAGGHTVAVLGNGLDLVYPRENRGLAERIIASRGALLAEVDFGVRASAQTLVQRDRLQSGLSAGTVVCESDIAGGSMHTARFTLEQGRVLFCPVPRAPYDSQPKSSGLHHLLRAGAVPIDGQENIGVVMERCLPVWQSLCR